MNKKFIYLACGAVVIIALLVFARTRLVNAPKVNKIKEGRVSVNPSPVVIQKANPNIRLDNILPNAVIASPLTVTGSAKSWYFEGSFPVKLVNSLNQTIFTGVATAQTDWMSVNFVPFSTTITFAPQIPGSSGQIIFMKDNPSGEPQNDDQYILPIVF